MWTLHKEIKDNICFFPNDFKMNYAQKSSCFFFFFFTIKFCGLLQVNLLVVCHPHSLKREMWGLLCYGFMPGHVLSFIGSFFWFSLISQPNHEFLLWYKTEVFCPHSHCREGWDFCAMTFWFTLVKQSLSVMKTKALGTDYCFHVFFFHYYSIWFNGFSVTPFIISVLFLLLFNVTKNKHSQRFTWMKSSEIISLIFLIPYILKLKDHLSLSMTVFCCYMIMLMESHNHQC